MRQDEKFFKDIGDLLERAPDWIDRTQTTTVLTSAAVLEQALEAALMSRMRPLTKKMRNRLFEGYGPISTFAARIDLIYALGIISEEEYSDLLVIKNVRNKFAHSHEVLGFEKDEVADQVKKLHCPDKKADTAYRQYFAALFGIANKLATLAGTSGSPNTVVGPGAKSDRASAQLHRPEKR